ncbi:hypothetical protein BU23DRAFT_123425 [Bimuria novae-zelandiae CBS 107.79]|uniref:Uncharacterized protein n=1 Tax=Bimuria novae-zelandiae CBS 107.79 TaxID=1447943 RepID=A0A6A5VBN3_9PLEO|nr:hypothetical protein BU23DRAFT_123425 [Bimuria novae-zelandiae CBS 107.79]
MRIGLTRRPKHNAIPSRKRQTADRSNMLWYIRTQAPQQGRSSFACILHLTASSHRLSSCTFATSALISASSRWWTYRPEVSCASVLILTFAGRRTYHLGLFCARCLSLCLVARTCTSGIAYITYSGYLWAWYSQLCPFLSGKTGRNSPNLRIGMHIYWHWWCRGSMGSALRYISAGD